MRILIVEDEKNLNNIIQKKLKTEGYDASSCRDGKDALALIEAFEYDLVLLDVMLPGIDGFTVLKKMRNKGINTPVLLLTARNSVSDKVKGLDLGANDYLTKPFAFEELLARIRALIREKSGHSTNTYTLADLSLDTLSRSVKRGGKNISLSSKEFTLLEYMLANKNVVLSREKLGVHIWGYDYEGSSNMIDVYIRYLRKKIDENFTPRLIHTVRGVGYVLREECS